MLFGINSIFSTEVSNPNSNIWNWKPDSKVEKENAEEFELEESFLKEYYGDTNLKDYEDILYQVDDVIAEIISFGVKDKDIENVYYKTSKYLIEELVVHNVPYEMQPFLYEYLRMTSKEKGSCTSKKNGAFIKVTMEISGDYLPPESVEVNGAKCVSYTIIAPESRKEKKMSVIDFETLKEELSDNFSEITLDWIEQRKKN